jgi:hypothetical protein
LSKNCFSGNGRTIGMFSNFRTLWFFHNFRPSLLSKAPRLQDSRQIPPIWPPFSNKSQPPPHSSNSQPLPTEVWSTEKRRKRRGSARILFGVLWLFGSEHTDFWVEVINLCWKPVCSFADLFLCCLISGEGAKQLCATCTLFIFGCWKHKTQS